MTTMSDLQRSNAPAPATPLSPWLPAVQQAAFRQLLRAFSNPGRRLTLDTPSDAALMTVLATLLDGSTSLADPQVLLNSDEHRRLAAIPMPVEQAQFVLLSASRAPDFTPALGTLESPEEGATLILVLDSLTEGEVLRLSGPGIDGDAILHVAGADTGWWEKRSQWNAAFPMGIDLILVAGQQIAAIPRTTRIMSTGDQAWAM